MRTQQRALVECQFIPRPVFGLVEKFLWIKDQLFLGWHSDEVSNDVISLVSFKLAAFRFSPVRLLFFFTESLILAQDERWRRA